MGRITVFSGVDENRTTAVLEIREDDKPLAHVTFDAAELEGLIRKLSKLRVHMAEQVAPELDPFSRIDDPVDQPAWKVPDTHTGPANRTMLLFRHPGMGWLGFLLEPERANAISGALANAPPNQR